MHIILHFSNLRKPYTVQINLFDTPVVRRWFDFFQSAKCKYTVNDINLHSVLPYSESVVNLQWQVILQSLQRLRDLGFAVPFCIPAKFDHAVSTLNMLHRFYTYNSLWYNEQHQPNPFDANFALPSMTYAEWQSYIDPINLGVHAIEAYVSTAHREWVTNHAPVNTMRLFRHFAATDWDKPSWLQFTSAEQDLNYCTLDYSRGWPVMLDQCILGRSYYNAFLQHDDPTARDCTGRVGSYGGIEIDLNTNRQQVYDSEVFAAWLQQHGATQTSLPLEFQIGWVDANTDLGFRGGRFVSAEFVN